MFYYIAVSAFSTVSEKWLQSELRLTEQKSDFIKTTLRSVNHIAIENYYIFVTINTISQVEVSHILSHFSPFVCFRCTFSKELPAGVQEGPEPSLQGVCACLHSSL